jgi:hypothetical protein
MTDERRADARPWIVASALGVIAIALAAVILFVIRPDRHDKQNLADAVGLTATQQQAIDAATKQALNLTTYSRKSFEADYARALAGSAGDLAKDLGDPTKKAALLSNMTKGKVDLQGQVLNTAFEQEADGKFAVLVLVVSYKQPDQGARTVGSRARFEMTLSHGTGKWLVSGLKNVGLV